MTDEEKKEYRDKLVEDCMKYNHIDYDDDKDIVDCIRGVDGTDSEFRPIQFDRPSEIACIFFRQGIVRPQGEVSERYTATHKCGLNHATQ